MTARVLVNGTYENGKVTFNEYSYPAKLTDTVNNLVYRGEIHLAESNLLILVVHTIDSDKEVTYKDNLEQEPYLGFTVIGVAKNQKDIDLDIVNITGKVIYENIQHQFILVKLWQNNNYEIIKVNGVLEDSIINGKGTAVDKIYKITSVIEGNSLIVDSSERLDTIQSMDNLVPFRSRNYRQAA